MKSNIKNIVWIIIAIVISNIVARNFGEYYLKLAPQVGGPWIGTQSAWGSLIGFPFAYIFFDILFLKNLYALILDSSSICISYKYNASFNLKLL